MQLFNTLTFVITLAFGGASVATADSSNNKDANYIQSQRCAGALSIMTSLGFSDETSPIYKYFSDLTDFHFSLFEYYVSKHIDNSNMGDVRRSVSKGIVLVDEEMVKDPNSLQATVKNCLSWLSAVNGHFIEQDPEKPLLEVMAAMPRPSKDYEYPFSDWSPMIPVTELAYELWVGTNLRDFHRCQQDIKNQTIDCMLTSE